MKLVRSYTHREVTQSRHIAAYATDPSLTVNYSGTAVRMEHEWPPTLLKIKELVEARLGTTFNVRWPSLDSSDLSSTLC